MMTIPKNEHIVQYLKNAIEIINNPILSDTLLPRLIHQNGIVRFLVDSKIPLNHQLEWGGINNSSFTDNLVQFLCTFRNQKDILFLFVDAVFQKFHPCMKWNRHIENIIFCNDRTFYHATTTDTEPFLRETIKNAYASDPAVGLIVRGNYSFSKWQDISESILFEMVENTFAILSSAFDGEAYIVYEFIKKRFATQNESLPKDFTPFVNPNANYYNFETKEWLHDDMKHSGEIAPHWDYKDPSGTVWRIFQDGTRVPKHR